MGFDYMDSEWVDAIARVAQEVVGGKQFKGTLVTTAYNAKTHAVKGMIVPHGIESGWVPIATGHVGNGYGILIGPKVGDPQKLDGDQFDIEFDLASPNSIVAKHKQFSNVDKPPEVQSGEMLLQHESGNKVFFDQGKNLTMQHHAGAKLILHDDKSITLQHASGTNVSWDADGNITHDSKDKKLTIKASMGGDVSLSTTGGLSLGGATLAISGPATLNGQPIATT